MNLRNFLLFPALMLSLQAAYTQNTVTFTIDELKFHIHDNTCSVSAASYDISGDITIPSTAAYKEIVYPVTAINAGAFAGCRSLTSVTIPNSITTIEERAFFSCMSLTSVTIPGSVTTIGDYAFRSCFELTSVTIPASVTTIGWEVFYNCVSLTSVTIPNSVTTIEERAFFACMSLKSITIPASVTTISDYAFSNCQSLEDVTVTQTIPIQIKENTFNGILLSKVTLHVPPGTEAIYRATPIWKDFNLATTVNNEQITPPAPLQTWSANGTLHITGLCPGKPFSLHTIHGQLIHKSTARTTEETIPLHTPGIYILTTEKTHIKISL